jgi:hypothetical protein
LMGVSRSTEEFCIHSKNRVNACRIKALYEVKLTVAYTLEISGREA